MQDDVISCLWSYYKDLMDAETTLISWSDNCVSQNTSWRILFFHAWLVMAGYFRKCDLKTFEVGHTYTMCDLYFGSIENKAKKKTILTADMWANVMKEAGRTNGFAKSISRSH